MLAKLSVGHPGAAFSILLEGKRIDKDRLPSYELYVVGTTIPEGHPELEGFLLDIERSEGSVLELAEAPFVGVGYERYLLRPYHLVGKLRSRAWQGDFFVGDYQSSLHQSLVEPGLYQAVVVILVDGINLTIDRTIMPENEPARIPE